MSDTIIVIMGLMFSLFVLGWVTVLPTIGLLYWIGYLQ